MLSRSLAFGVISGVMFSLSLLAAETASTFTVKPLGMVDLRPSLTSKSGELHTENTLELGAQMTPDVSVTYLHALNTNLFAPNSEATQGFKAYTDGGFIRTRVGNILKNTEGDLTLSYQSRVYLPVDKASQDAGQIFAARNYFTLTKKFSDSFSFAAVEMPVLFAYDHAGYLKTDGTPTVNSAFENRVYFVGSFTFSDKLSLDFPLMFHQTKKRNFRTDAANNDAWTFFVWINPEITYQVSENYSVGLGYYSDNLVKSDLKQLSVGDGLEQGVVQVSFAASL